MADRVAAHNWRPTPIGPISKWPESLKAAVGICIASPMPTFVWWGPDLINIYNDAYAPLLGGRHPAALGASARKLWAGVWPTIGDDVENTLQHGTSVIRDRVRFVLKRKGFPDEMFFTYTFSPIPDGKGGIGGVFQVATDETARVLAEQQQQAAHARAEQSRKKAQADNEQRLAYWQAVIANMPEGVVLADADGNLVDWNSAALDMFGYSNVEEVRLSLLSMAEYIEVYDTDGQLIPPTEWPMARLLRGQAVGNRRVWVRRRNGSQPDRLLICNGTLIRDADNKIRFALLTMHDATAHRSSPESAAPVMPNTRLGKLKDDREQLKADYAAARTEALLENLDLTPEEQEFCQSLGQQLVQQAIGEFQLTHARNKSYDGSCIAASLTIALIIVNDL